MKRKKLALRAIGLGSLLGWASAVMGQVEVAVSVPPYTELVAELGGGTVSVRCVQDTGDSCSLFEARPGTVAFLERAELFFRTGVAYEQALLGGERNVFEKVEVVDLREAVELIPFGTGVGAGAETGPQHGHEHAHGERCAGCAGCADSPEGMDPHHWMDPVRMGQQLERIAEALEGHMAAEEAALLRERLAGQLERLAALDENLKAQLSPYAGRAFFIYHPSLGYFADRYGLRQVGIAAPGRAPSARELKQYIEQGRELGIQTILVQPQESRKQAEVLAAALGAEVVEVDPMAEDWEGALREIGRVLEAGFASEDAG